MGDILTSMPLQSRRLALGLAALLVVALSTGARAHTSHHQRSNESLTAAQLVAGSETVMMELKSFHVAGMENDNGTTTFSLTVSPNGGGGTVSVPGATLQIVVIGVFVYVKANEQSWLKLGAGGPTAQLLAGHWVKVPATNSSLADFADLTISSDFISESFGDEPGIVKLPGTTTWHRTKAIVLVDRSGDKLYVQAKGAPCILHVQAKGSASYLTFSELGDAPVPAAPSNAIPLPAG
jgi:hypothetical protein